MLPLVTKVCSHYDQKCSACSYLEFELFAIFVSSLFVKQHQGDLL